MPRYGEVCCVVLRKIGGRMLLPDARRIAKSPEGVVDVAAAVGRNNIWYDGPERRSCRQRVG